ncbi:MAG: ATP-dependent helicase HrpB [Acidimicrobiales bacterium]
MPLLRDAGALPVDAVLDEVVGALRQRRRVVVTASPGSGKTTRVPLAVADALANGVGAGSGPGRVLVLEPRRVAARAMARFLAARLGDPVGATIGLSTRDERLVGPATRIELITEGVLTRRLQRDPELPGVAAVLFDEFHERSLVADTGLALTLDVADGLRPDLWVGVLSATIDAAAVAALLGDAPVVNGGGRAHPVQVHHRPRAAGDDPTVATAEVVLEALRTHAGDVLAFLPGVAEIRRCADRLRDRVGGSVDVHPLHGQLRPAEQDRALAASPPGRRRVVLATNVAETSLTVAGVSVVVDSGLVRRAVATVTGDAPTDASGVEGSDPDLGAGTAFTRLRTERVSRAEADQRTGRAGRLGPGHAYRLWSAADDERLRAWPAPEILGADLTALALELAAWGVTDAAALRWLDPPPAPALARARAVLGDLGLVHGGRLTEPGRSAVALGVDARVAAMLLAAARAGEAERTAAASLAALVEDGDPFDRSHAATVGADIGARLDALLHGGGGLDEGRRRRLRDRAATLRRRLDAVAAARRDRRARRAWRAAADADPGALLLAGFADRLAQRRRDGDHRYRLRHGGGVRLAERDPLTRHRLLVIVDAAGGDADGELAVRLAAPVDPARIERGAPQRAAAPVPPVERRLAIRWDPAAGDGGDVVARWEERLDALVLRDGPAAPEDLVGAAAGGQLTAALLEGIRRRGLDLLGGAAERRRLQQRVAFLRATLGDGWPHLSDDALLADLERWLAPFLAGCRRARDLAGVDTVAALRLQLDPAERGSLDRLAPDTVTIPSGRAVAVDYEGEVPAVAAKLQEFFGAAELPPVAGGAVRLVARLLSPAGRPVAVTDDLARFWTGAYPSVRAELRGRYPKHPWPTDPQRADATSATNRAIARRADPGPDGAPR